MTQSRSTPSRSTLSRSNPSRSASGRSVPLRSTPSRPRPTRSAILPRAARRLALGASLLAFGAVPAWAEEFTLNILHLNDPHARIQPINRFNSDCSEEDDAAGECFGGFARLKTLIEERRAALEGPTLVVSAGDHFQGSLFYTTYKGALQAEMAEAIGVDLFTLGNHEFDDGEEELNAFLEGVSFPVLAANVAGEDGSLVSRKVDPYVIAEFEGQRVGFVGAVAADTAETSSPGETIDIGADIEAIARAVEAVEAEGVDKIVAVTHIGLAADRRLAEAVPAIDLIIGGHSHTLLANTVEDAEGPYPTIVNDTPIVQAGAYGKYLGEIAVTFDEAGEVISAQGEPILVDASVAKDEALDARIAELAGPIEELKQKVVGETTLPIDGERENCRARECEMGNLVADAMLDRVADQGVRIALQNGGGLRASIDEGAVTMGEVLGVLPFQNTLATFELAGADIVASLENGVGQIEEGAGRFPQVAGLRFSFDPNAEPGARVSGVEVADGAGGFEPIDPGATYGVVTNDFVRRGGDGYDLFETNAQNAYDYGPGLEEVVADYIAAKGPVAPALDGRITDLSATTGDSDDAAPDDASGEDASQAGAAAVSQAGAAAVAGAAETGDADADAGDAAAGDGSGDDADGAGASGSEAGTADADGGDAEAIDPAAAIDAINRNVEDEADEVAAAETPATPDADVADVADAADDAATDGAAAGGAASTINAATAEAASSAASALSEPPTIAIETAGDTAEADAAEADAGEADTMEAEAAVADSAADDSAAGAADDNAGDVAGAASGAGADETLAASEGDAEAAVAVNEAVSAALPAIDPLADAPRIEAEAPEIAVEAANEAVGTGATDGNEADGNEADGNEADGNEADGDAVVADRDAPATDAVVEGADVAEATDAEANGSSGTEANGSSETDAGGSSEADAVAAVNEAVTQALPKTDALSAAPRIEDVEPGGNAAAAEAEADPVEAETAETDTPSAVADATGDAGDAGDATRDVAEPLRDEADEAAGEAVAAINEAAGSTDATDALQGAPDIVAAPEEASSTAVAGEDATSETADGSETADAADASGAVEADATASAAVNEAVAAATPALDPLAGAPDIEASTGEPTPEATLTTEASPPETATTETEAAEATATEAASTESGTTGEAVAEEAASGTATEESQEPVVAVDTDGAEEREIAADDNGGATAADEGEIAVAAVNQAVTEATPALDPLAEAPEIEAEVSSTEAEVGTANTVAGAGADATQGTDTAAGAAGNAERTDGAEERGIAADDDGGATAADDGEIAVAAVNQAVTEATPALDPLAGAPEIEAEASSTPAPETDGAATADPSAASAASDPAAAEDSGDAAEVAALEAGDDADAAAASGGDGAASPVVEAAEPREYVVQDGDTYWTLAERFYGDPLLHPVLEKANRAAARRLRVGSTILVPPKP